jgi:hypothetical protein
MPNARLGDHALARPSPRLAGFSCMLTQLWSRRASAASPRTPTIVKGRTPAHRGPIPERDPLPVTGEHDRLRRTRQDVYRDQMPSLASASGLPPAMWPSTVAFLSSTGPRSDCAVLDLRLARPEPDQAGEATDERTDDPVACECQPDFFGGRTAFRRCPGEAASPAGGEVASVSPQRRVARARSVVDVDQPGNGQQRLAGGPGPERVFGRSPGLRRLSPPLLMPGGVAVKAQGGPGIRRGRSGRVRSS